MERDPECMRDLLLQMEQDPSPMWLSPLTLGSDGKEHHHLQLLCDEGFVEQVNDSAYRLTSAGHDFILATKNPNAWGRIKTHLGSAFQGASLVTIKTVAAELVKKAV